MESNEEILKNVKERICKRESSLNLQFKVKSFFFGGYELKLEKDSPLSIKVNANGKTAIRFIMAPDEQFRLVRKDFGLCLTQFESFVITPDEQELPPMLACYMQPGCVERMCKSQPGLRDVSKTQMRYNTDAKFSKVLVFILKPWKADSEAYLKAEYKDQEKSLEHYIDIDDAISLLQKEIRAVWDQMNKEKKSRKERDIGRLPSDRNHVNAFTDTVNVVDHELFHRILYELKIFRKNDKKNFGVTFVDAKSAGVHTTFYGNNTFYTGKTGVPAAKRPRLEDDPRNKVRVTRDEVWVTRIASARKIMHNGTFMVPSEHHNHRVLQSHNGQTGMGLHGYPFYPNGANIDHLTAKMQDLGHTNNMENHLNYQYQYQHSTSFNGPNSCHAPLQNPSCSTANVFSQGDVYSRQKLSIKDRKRAVPGIENQPQAPVEPRVTGDEPLVTLPPSPFGGDTISLIIKDIKTLDRKEFVNDNVMEFMMNYICTYRIKKELTDKIHMFNTFFYNSLAKEISSLGFSGRVPTNPNDAPILERNSQRVQRWTRRFDLFTKDYIVIPVNEDYHWMVVAIINPSGALIEIGNEEESYNARKCYMLFYDPLSGLDPTRRLHVTHMIKEYLATMCSQTKGPEKKFSGTHGFTFDHNRVLVVRPKNAPIQNNFSDCGLYALHFIEGLFCGVDRFVTVEDFPGFDWAEWWPEADKMCEFMRDKIYNLIKKRAGPQVRSRIERYENDNRCGLSREGDLRRSRRHSAVPLRRTPRNKNYYRRSYSLNPPKEKVVTDEALFTNPRALANMPLTQRVRSLRYPEPSFPVAY